MAEKMDRTGEVINGVKIYAYRTAKDLDVIFPDGTIVLNKKYCHFKSSNIKNPNSPIVFGVGYFGVGKYNHKDNKKLSQTWLGMMQRCYSLDFKKNRHTYKDCTVHSDWHNFQNFAKWFEENYIEGYCLDKDFTVMNNKEYSENTCKFIPNKINVILTNVSSSNKKYLVGVNLHKTGKFQATLSIKNKRVYLGLFDKEIEAFIAYKKAKEAYLKEQLICFRNEIGEIIFNNLINYSINQ